MHRAKVYWGASALPSLTLTWLPWPGKWGVGYGGLGVVSCPEFAEFKEAGDVK